MIVVSDTTPLNYKAALERGLKATTTLGILEEASHRGLIDFEKTIERLEKETTFYVTDDVIQAFKRRVRERTLAAERERQAKAKQPKRRKKKDRKQRPEGDIPDA